MRSTNNFVKHVGMAEYYSMNSAFLIAVGVFKWEHSCKATFPSENCKLERASLQENYKTLIHCQKSREKDGQYYLLKCHETDKWVQFCVWTVQTSPGTLVPKIEYASQRRAALSPFGKHHQPRVTLLTQSKYEIWKCGLTVWQSAPTQRIVRPEMKIQLFERHIYPL